MGHVEVMDYLLELCRPLKKSTEQYKFGYFHRGLDINAVNKENKTALQVAAEKGEIYSHFFQTWFLLDMHWKNTVLVSV